MSDARASVRLSDDEMAKLDELVERHGRSRSSVIRRIVQTYFERGAKPPLFSTQGVVHEALSAAQLATVACRSAIIRRWREARLDARRRGNSIEQATITFLAKLRREGVRVSRATLFNWDRRRLRQGGLLDRRQGR